MASSLGHVTVRDLLCDLLARDEVAEDQVHDRKLDKVMAQCRVDVVAKDPLLVARDGEAEIPVP